MKIPLMLLINGCRNGQDVVEVCIVASSITQERKRSQGRINHFIYTVRTHVFVLQTLDYFLRLLYPLILTI